MRRQRGLVMAAATLPVAAFAVTTAEAVLAQSYLVTIVDATPGRCSVRTPTAPACYSPQSISVPAGSTVEWYNRSTLQHTVTGTGANAGWGSGTINSNGIYSHTFSAPGTYTYHCTIHTGMTGTVYVGDLNASTSSTESTQSGTTSFSISSPATQPFTSTTTSTSSATTSSSATSSDTTDTGDVALAGGDSGSDTFTSSATSHSSAPAAVAGGGGGSGFSAALVVVLLLLLIGGASTAALVLTRPGRAPRR